jgi:hypothetical protein
MPERAGFSDFVPKANRVVTIACPRRRNILPDRVLALAERITAPVTAAGETSCPNAS